MTDEYERMRRRWQREQEREYARMDLAITVVAFCLVGLLLITAAVVATGGLK